MYWLEMTGPSLSSQANLIFRVRLVVSCASMTRPSEPNPALPSVKSGGDVGRNVVPGKVVPGGCP